MTGRFRLLLVPVALALAGSGISLAAAQPGAAATSGAAGRLAIGARSGAGGQSGAGDCIARHPNEAAGSIWYADGCSGHDEPEIDPVSARAGSAQDLTWTVVLPSDGAVPVSSVGTAFWFGGTVTDPNPHALFGQGFVELQFYPDAIVNNCSQAGGYNVSYAPDKFSVCSPVWQVSSQSFAETAAFNAELHNDSTSAPLVMNAGDTIRVHFFVASPDQGWNINVADLTTGQSGTIVLNSGYGPMLPAFSSQQIGNALGWGLVDDTPNSFVWEIGHTSNFAKPSAQFCVAGQATCDSYDTAHWLGFSPLRIKSVTFADGSAPKQWAVVSDLGGTAEVNKTCASYGGPFCTYPWYALNGSAGAFTFGADYPGTSFDYGQGSQFATTMQCGGPFGPDSTYCDTIINPAS